MPAATSRSKERGAKLTARTAVRRSGLVAAAAFGALALGLALELPTAPPVASVSPASRDLSLESSVDGTAATAIAGWSPSVSDDGRIVAYVGPTADERERTVYLRDRQLNVLLELTAPQGVVRPGDSDHPVVSADGCTVTVITEMAYDLFRDDDRFDRWDVYRTTLPHCGGTWGDWELVSAGPRGAIDGVDPTQRPSVSASGQVVAFVVPDDRAAPTYGRITVVDLTVPLGELGRSVTVPGLPSRTPTGPFRYIGHGQPSLSGDGAVLALTTDAVPGTDGAAVWSTGDEPGGPARTQVAIWRRAEPTAVPRLVSATASGQGRADQPALSADGWWLAFRSSAPDLVDDVVLPPCSDSGCAVDQVYVSNLADGFERLTDVHTVVSARRTGGGEVEAGRSGSSQPSITRDGQAIVFITRAPELVQGKGALSDRIADGELVLADVSSGALSRLVVQSDGASPAARASSSPHLGTTGRVVVFDTAAAHQLVEGGEGVIGRQVALVSMNPRMSMPALDMGTVPVNWPSPEWYVTLTNEGPGAFVPAEISVADPAVTITGGTCVPLVPLPPGASCTVTLVFTPIAEGPARSTLTIAEAGFGALTVSTIIDGAGGEPTLSARPAGIDAGAITVGERSEPVSVELTNIGFATASVANVEVFGEHPEDFEVSVDRCRGRSFGPTTSCTVEVVATPRGAGSRSALLTFVTPTGQRTSVVLSARGRYAPSVVASPTAGVGQPITLGGLGFPVSSPVLVTVGDGARSVTVSTGEWGELDLRLVLPRTLRPGDHGIVITDVNGSFDPVILPLRITAPARGASALSPALRGTP